MSIAVFPRNLVPTMAGSEEHHGEYQVLVKRGVGPVRQARRQLTLPLFSARYTFILQYADQRTVQAFIDAVHGPAEVFSMFTYDRTYWHRRRLIGTGDGSEYVFTLPFGCDALDDAILSLAGVDLSPFAWDRGYDQQLKQAGDLTDLTDWPDYDGATSVRAIYTPGLDWQPTWRIQTTGGGSTNKLDQTTAIPDAGLSTITRVWVKNIKPDSDPDYGALRVSTVGGSVDVLNDGDWHEVSVSWTATGVDACYMAFEAEDASYDLDFLVTKPSVSFHSELGWGWLPTRGDVIDADESGRFKMAFLPGTTPGAGEELWFEEGRGRMHHFVALDGDPRPPKKLADNIYQYEFGVVEAEP